MEKNEDCKQDLKSRKIILYSNGPNLPNNYSIPNQPVINFNFGVK
jgi:hypothetical protein